MIEELFDEIWLSDNNSIILFSQEEAETFHNNTLTDEGSPTEFSIGGFRKVKLVKKLTKAQIIKIPENELLKLIIHDPTQW